MVIKVIKKERYQNEIYHVLTSFYMIILRYKIKTCIKTNHLH